MAFMLLHREVTRTGLKVVKKRLKAVVAPHQLASGSAISAVAAANNAALVAQPLRVAQ